MPSGQAGRETRADNKATLASMDLEPFKNVVLDSGRMRRIPADRYV